MSKHEKLLEKLKRKQFGFTFKELENLLTNLGYIVDNREKSSGSRVAFINDDLKHSIRLHKPHGKELKDYQVKQISEELKDKGFIK